MASLASTHPFRTVLVASDGTYDLSASPVTVGSGQGAARGGRWGKKVENMGKTSGNWGGLRENLQEHMGFPVIFSPKPV